MSCRVGAAHKIFAQGPPPVLRYRLLLTCLAPFFIAALAVRVLRGRETWTHFKMRLGIGNAARHARPVIWVHGASNGELTAARSFLEHLLDASPDLGLLITCNTPSALNMVQSWQVDRTDVRLAPIDLRACLSRMLRGRDIRLFAQLEADFWPGRIDLCTRRGIPKVLLSGRISEKSADQWSTRARLRAPVFGTWDLVLAQDADSEARFKALGVPHDIIGPLLPLKHAYSPQASETKGEAAPFLRAATWLAASTHEGEDETLLDAHIEARRRIPELRMILAPRHPKRGGDIADMASAKGLTYHRISWPSDMPEDTDVLIADTLGDMPRWYEASYACFVAGSLAPKGGHTPFEPIAHGCAVLHGPHVANFAAAYDALHNAQGAIAARTPSEIAQALLNLRDASMRHAQAKRARACVKVLQDEHAGFDSVVEQLRGLVFE